MQLGGESSETVAPHLFCVYTDFFFFLGPLGFDSGLCFTPFGKNEYSKKTINPNPSPIGKIGFGLY